MPVDFALYRVLPHLVEIRPYVPGEDMTGITVQPTDADAGSPKDGDVIARDSIDYTKMWVITAEVFRNNYELA